MRLEIVCRAASALNGRTPRLAAPLKAASLPLPLPPVGTEVIYSVSEVEEEKEGNLLDCNRVRENMAERRDTSPAVESK